MKRKRILATIGTAALVWGMVGGIAPAHAQDNASQFCREIEPILELIFQADISHGACVSAEQAGNITALASSFCKDPEFRAAAEQIAGQPLNHGQCTNVVKSALEA